MERSPSLRNQGGGAGAAPRSCLPCSCSRSRSQRGGPGKRLRRVGMRPGRAFGLAARAADLSHPTRNLPFQESSSSWEPGTCSAVDVSALPAFSPALPRGLYLCLRELSSSSSRARLGGGVSGWSKPLPCTGVDIFGMWKKIRAKAPDTQKRCGWERNQKPACLHPAWGWSRVRVGYQGMRGGVPALSLSLVGASPWPAFTLGTAGACRVAIQTPTAILHAACQVAGGETRFCN